MDAMAHVCANLGGRKLLPLFLLINLLTATHISIVYALPYAPSDPEFILESLPKTLQPKNKTFSMLRKQLNLEPDNIDIVSKLANAYVSYGKRASDLMRWGHSHQTIR